MRTARRALTAASKLLPAADFGQKRTFGGELAPYR